MNEAERNQVLVTMLEMLANQAVQIDRMTKWTIALAETVRKNPQLASDLEQHPFYDQGDFPTLRSTAWILGKVDELVHQLKASE